MNTDSNNQSGSFESGGLEPGIGQPSQDDVFAASPPFANAGDGFADAPSAAASPHIVPMGMQNQRAGEVTCHQLHANLGVYLDGELDVSSNAAVQQHLAVCGPCQTAQAFQMQFRSTLAAKAFDPIPDDARARITKALGF